MFIWVFFIVNSDDRYHNTIFHCARWKSSKRRWY